MTVACRSLALRACAVGFAALVASERGFAQAPEEGLVFGQRPRPEKFHVEGIHGYAELLARFVSNSAKSKLDFNPSESETDTTIYSEALHLGTNGYILHPNFIEWNASGKLSFEQSETDSAGVSTSEDQQLYEWDLRATILRNSSAPVNVYTSQTQSLVSQPFGPTLRQISTIYGADVSVKSATLPTEIRLYRSEQTQSSLGGQEDFSIAQNVLEWQTEWRMSSRQSLIGRVVYVMTDQTSGLGESTSSDSYTASLAHRLRMGARQQYVLSSQVSTSKTTGLFGNETQEWNEELRMYHSLKFETDIRYHLNQTTFEPDNASGFGPNTTTEQDLQELSAGFRHQLYESLTTTGRVGMTQVDVQDSTNDTTFGTLNFAYNKRVPRGLLLSSLGLSYSTQDSESRAAAIPVLNESLPIASFAPVDVRRQGIVPGSLVVRTPTGRILSPVSDYRVQYFPNFMRIDPLPGGNIDVGDTVLLNYELEPQPAFSSTLQTLTYSLRYDIQQGPLRGLSPYLAYAMQDQSIDAHGPTTLVAENVRDLTLGADYTVGELLLNGEYELRDSNVTSFNAWRARARYNQRLGPDTRLGLEARYAFYDYTEPVDQVTTTSLGAALNHRAGRTLIVTGTVSWLDIEDDIAGKTQGLEEQLELQWRHRQLEFFVQFRNSTLETETHDQTFQLLQVGVRRYF